MREEYDFSKGVRGAVVPVSPGKKRITIWLNEEVIEWFHDQCEKAGGGSYQSMINNALRDHIRRGGESLEEMLRRVLREELGRAV